MNEISMWIGGERVNASGNARLLRHGPLSDSAARSETAQATSAPAATPLACGGKVSSTLMPATLLDRVHSDIQIYSEESFGPVKPVVRVRGVESFTELRWITWQTTPRHYPF